MLLARQGQDLSKYDLKYSHYGWAYRTPAGPWRVAHKLNECGTASGHIYRQGLGEFFLDDMWRYEAAIQIPTPAVQQALLAGDALVDEAKLQAIGRLGRHGYARTGDAFDLPPPRIG